MSRAEMKCDCESIHDNILEIVKKNIYKELDIFKMTEIYKSLADTTRMKIVSALYVHEMCVCDICVLLNMTKSAISHQLRYLKDTNIVICKKIGKEVFYSLKDEHIKSIYELTMYHIKERVL